MYKIKYTRRSDQGFIYEIVINTEDEEMYESVDKFLNDYPIEDKTGQNVMLEILINDIHVDCLSKINDDTFLDLFWSLKDRLNSPLVKCSQSTKRRVMFGFINYIRFLQENNYIHMHLYTQKILEFKGIIKKIEEGYEPVLYSSFSVIPESRKILIDVSEFESFSGTRKSLRPVYAVDFSDIRNTMLVEETLYYLFYAPIKFGTKYQNLNVIRKLLYILDESFPASEGKIRVQMKHINAFKKRNAKLSDASKFLNMSVLRSFLEFIKDRKRITINPNLLFFTKQHNVNSNGSTVAYTKNEIERILAQLSKSKAKRDRIIWYIIQLQANTPLRAASIINLEVNCLNDINGHEKYEILYSSKTSIKDHSNIDRHSAELIKQAINEFMNDRLNAMQSLRKFLFVYMTEKTRKYVKVTQAEYTARINDISRNLGINELGQAGIRNYYNQQLTKYAEDTNKDTSLVTALSMHSIGVHLKHYNDYSKIVENYENFYHVSSIGSINLTITKAKPEEQTSSAEVENGLGFCSCDHCEEMNMLGCFVCRFFRVSEKNISFYKKAIAGIDERIYNEEITHEKEFLVTKKKIFVKILQFLETDEGREEYNR